MSGLLLSYYGDDFTGSTDALEALAANGVPTVLFLRLPEDAHLARFSGCRAVGLAGASRSKSRAWMRENLPAVFRRLKDLGAPVCHYKVCSTFDSSPEIGSIGCALEIGQEIFRNPYVPVVLGVPVLGRYVLFGNLFARAGTAIYRIDRHPTMKCHPVTPMTESDLRLHLARQTGRTIGLVDILAVSSGGAEQQLEALVREGAQVVIFDGLDEASLEEIGRIVWTRRPRPQTFVVGSSGLDYALIAHWRATGGLPPKPEFPDPGPVERLVVVSGSCSPVTERQIRWAMANGFTGVRVEPGRAVEGARAEALAALAAGRSVVLYTALGPQDRRDGVLGEQLGEQLGDALRELLELSGVRRAVVAGGDTASHAGQRLGVYALSMLRPLDPGTPLCRGYSDEARLDGLELAFKGGQVGAEDFFGVVRRGKR
jgi:uncharacterized protein YgbK (DUF1537 family)